ncbi:Glutaredoxin-3 [Leucoagaricus sp. SymC.cos]|nr:Glutaredoxin-3 [Leucoagaricus sp. SymC.cos]
MALNLHQVANTPHFQELLSEDLNRVSLIYFWASWAKPCEQMTEVVQELAKKYAKLLFLQVEAEEQIDIAESFDVEAVPAFVLLRGHTLLGRINGVDAANLTQLVGKHAATPSYRPLSHTDKKPASPPTETPAAPEKTEEESEEMLNERLRKLMNQNKVVLFMKGSPETPRCGFSRKIVAILQDQNINFSHFDILTDENVRQGLKKLNDWPTYPQLFNKGEFVGGLDIVQEMVESGELKSALD